MDYKQTKELEDQYLVPNYNPLPVVFVRGQDVWLYDNENNEYLDMMSAYSAVTQGHCHPRLVKVLSEQASKLTLTSRAFHNEHLCFFAEKLCKMSGFTKVLPMNSGAEAVETAVKLVRKWGYMYKKVEPNKAEIIVCNNNFHGRTSAAVSMSTDPQYRNGASPFLPGIVKIPYNDALALEEAITLNTVAFIVEPVQGEGGIIIPTSNYLNQVYEICKKHDVLFIVDEVQTGLGRTGKMFAFQHNNIHPDGMMLGKALSGGMFPVSCFLTTDEVSSAVRPGDHGSTFGGSALACAVANEALSIIEDEHLVQKSAELGSYFLTRLKEIQNPLIVEVRGKGLLIGVELDTNKINARVACEALLQNRIVSKDTHDKVLRFAPPLTVTKSNIDYTVHQLSLTLSQLIQNS